MQGPQEGSQRPDSYAGSAAPSIAGVSGQPPPIFTHQGAAAAASTTPMFVKGSYDFWSHFWGGKGW